MSYLLMTLLLAANSPAAGDSAGAEGARFAALAGHWACNGHFEPSGKPISATLDITWSAKTNTLSVAHDDVLPGQYHSIELWTPPTERAGFGAAIFDRFSGMRTYQSDGWHDNALAWTRSATDGSPIESFTYKLTSAESMDVTWHISREGRPLVIGDVIQCKKSQD